MQATRHNRLCSINNEIISRTTQVYLINSYGFFRPTITFTNSTNIADVPLNNKLIVNEVEMTKTRDLRYLRHCQYGHVVQREPESSLITTVIKPTH